LDENDKRSTQQKHRRQVKKQRSREELRLLKENSKRRRSGSNSGPRRKQVDWAREDSEPNFQAMKPAPQLDLKQAKQEAAEKAEREAQLDHENLPSALVVSVFMDRVRVSLDGSDQMVMLSPDGPRPAVGDSAYVQDDGQGNLRLAGLAERRTVLSRPDPQTRHKALVLAANVDTAVIVASAKAPGFRPALIDRCLIAIWHGGATPMVCLNKVDLIDAEQRGEMEARLKAYGDLGIEVLLTSTETGEGVAELTEGLSGKTCVLLGHSGVGKSSLLNAMDPERERRTSHGREFDGKGRHTTTASELVELADGTRLIDTPGVRSFGLWEIQGDEVQDYFPELAQVAGSCRYRDCSHLVEPGCGVPAAIAEGTLHEARFEAYRRIRASLEV
jgi:ribosome biogenesis GTPase